jgi:hypothetical protein
MLRLLLVLDSQIFPQSLAANWVDTTIFAEVQCLCGEAASGSEDQSCRVSLHESGYDVVNPKSLQLSAVA